jgi:ribosome-associated toxin RatA of RatAB toxin-antitoxin module
MIEIVKDSIDIAASASDVFAVASDVAAYPEWNANIKKADVLDHDEAGRATKVRMEVDAVIRTMTYTLDYDYSGAPRSFSWVLVEGELKELEGSYAFEESSDATTVSYEIRLDPGFFVPKPLRRQAERHIARAALEDLKKRVESVAQR